MAPDACAWQLPWSLRPTRPGPATGTKVCSFPTRGLSHRLSIGSREVCVGRFSRAESARLDGNLMQLRNACVGIGVCDICTCRHLGGDIALVLMAPFHTPLHRRPRKQKRSFLFSGTGVVASAGKYKPRIFVCPRGTEGAVPSPHWTDNGWHRGETDDALTRCRLAGRVHGRFKE